MNHSLEVLPTRNLCYQCFLNETHCICGDISVVNSSLKIILLQHIRERHKSIGTEKIVRLSVPGTTTYTGIRFQNQKELTALLTDQNQQGYLLYPCSTAIPAGQVQLDPLRSNYVVAIDGTWPHANRIYRENPLLKNLIPITLQTDYISNYRIRTQPNSLCLSTVEAVVLCLEALEHAPGKYSPLLNTFDRMIDKQCKYIPEEFLKNRKKFRKLISK
jgi:DTW domain-containing protein YfiP